MMSECSKVISYGSQLQSITMFNDLDFVVFLRNMLINKILSMQIRFAKVWNKSIDFIDLCKQSYEALHCAVC